MQNTKLYLTQVLSVLFMSILGFSCNESDKSSVILRSENELLTFVFPSTLNSALTNDVTAIIEQSANQITARVPKNTNITQLKAKITLSPGATISPDPSIARDYTNGTNFTIMAENGADKKVYIVTVFFLPSTESVLSSFVFPSAINTALTSDVMATIEESTGQIIAQFPKGTDLTQLRAETTISDGATISPDPFIARDYSSGAISYTVTAEDGTNEKTYQINTSFLPSMENALLTFVFPSAINTALTSDVMATINQSTGQVTAQFPMGTDISRLRAETTISDGATISPDPSLARDYSSGAISYTVTAENRINKQIYQVNASFLPSMENALLTFVFPLTINTALTSDVMATIDQRTGQVMAQFPKGTNLSRLRAEVTISSGATISPDPSIARDYTSGVHPTFCCSYTVTAADGVSRKTYQVTTSFLPSMESILSSFVFPSAMNASLTSDVRGTIDQNTGQVIVEIPRNIAIIQLRAEFTISNGATISPDPSSARDYTSGVSYTVTAENGMNVKIYKVTISRLPSTENILSSFVFPSAMNASLTSDIRGTIDQNTGRVIAEIPRNIAITQLKAETTISDGATISPDPSSARDYTSGVSYTVTAENGMNRKFYQVTISFLPSMESILSSFVFPSAMNASLTSDVRGTIDQNTGQVTAEIPRNIAITQLKAEFTISNRATINPDPSSARDYTTDVSYTVTAENGMNTKIYQVTISRLPSTESILSSFVFPSAMNASLASDVTAIINQNIGLVSAQFPKGTDLSRLQAEVTISGGATINPDPSIANDYTSEVSYTVTAEDGISRKEYRIIAYSTFEFSRNLAGRKGIISSVAYSPPDGTHIVAGSFDDSVRIWEANTGSLIHTLGGHGDQVSSVSYSPDGTHVVSGSWDDSIKIWEANTGSLVRTISRPANQDIHSVSYSPDGTQIVSGSFRDIEIWEAGTGNRIRVFQHGPRASVFSVSYSPDGKRIISGGDDRTIRIWEAKTGTLMHTLTGHTSFISSISYSPDGNYILSGDAHTAIRIWDANTGRLIHTLMEHTDQISSVSYSPDGRHFASGSSDNTIKIWESETGRLIQTLRGHSSSVNSIHYSPDGRYIVSGSSDRSVKIWCR